MTEDHRFPTVAEYLANDKFDDLNKKLDHVINSEDHMFLGMHRITSTKRENDFYSCPFLFSPTKAYDYTGIEGIIHFQNISSLPDYDIETRCNFVVFGLYMYGPGMLFVYAVQLNPTREEINKYIRPIAVEKYSTYTRCEIRSDETIQTYFNRLNAKLEADKLSGTTALMDRDGMNNTLIQQRNNARQEITS